MRLSLATKSDFAFCKKLYDDNETDMIYRREDIAEEQESDSSIEDFCDEETLAQIVEEFELTQEKFEERLTKDYERTFVIYDDANKQIGFFYLFLLYHNNPSKSKEVTNRWKLADMCLIKSAQKAKIFRESLNLLLQDCDEIDVCTCVEKRISQFLKAGFGPQGTKFYLRKRKEQLE